MLANAALIRPWTVLQSNNGSITTGPLSMIWSGSTPAWSSNSGAGTAYVQGNYIVSAGNIYWESVASCTGATSGAGPSGTGTAITDGSCSWNYVTQAYQLNVQSSAWATGTVTAGNYYSVIGSTTGNLYWASTGCTATTQPSGTGQGIATGDGCVYNYVSPVQSVFGNVTPSYLYATVNWPNHGRSVGDVVQITPAPDLGPWYANQTWAASSIILSNNKIYKSSGICTSGTVPVTGNGTVSDGTCSWVQQTVNAWTATTYTQGQYVTNGGNYYIETVASCTATTAPTTQTLQIADNNCKWNYQGSTTGPTPAWTGANPGGTQGSFNDSAYFGVFKVVAINDANNITVVLRRQPGVAFTGSPVNIRLADQNITIGGGGTLDYNWLNNSATGGIGKETVIMAGVYNLNIDGLRGINQNNHLLDMNGVAVSDVAHLNVGVHSGIINTELVKVYGPYFDGTIRDLSGNAYDDVMSYQTQDAPIFDQYVVACGDIIGARAQHITSEGGNAVNIYVSHQFLLTDDILFEDVNVHNSITLRSPIMLYGDASGYVTTGVPTIGNIFIKRGGFRDNLSGAYPYVQAYATSASAGSSPNTGSGPLTIQHLDIDGSEQPFNENQSLIPMSSGRIFGANIATSAGVTINNLTMHNIRTGVGTTASSDGVFNLGVGTFGVVTLSDSWIIGNNGQGYLFITTGADSTKRIIERNNYIYNLGSVNRVTVAAENIDMDSNYINSSATTDAVDVVNISGSTFTFRNNTINNAGNGLVRFNTGPYTANVISEGGNVLTGASVWLTFPAAGTPSVYGFDIPCDVTKIARVTGTYCNNTNAAPGSGTLTSAGLVIDQGTAANSWVLLANPTGQQY